MSCTLNVAFATALCAYSLPLLNELDLGGNTPSIVLPSILFLVRVEALEMMTLGWILVSDSCEDTASEER